MDTLSVSDLWLGCVPTMIHTLLEFILLHCLCYIRSVPKFLAFLDPAATFLVNKAFDMIIQCYVLRV